MKVGANSSWSGKVDDALPVVAAAKSCTRVMIVAADSANLEAIVSELRSRSPHLDDMIPEHTHEIAVAELPKPPEKHSVQTRAQNEQKMELLKFASKGEDGETRLFQKINEVHLSPRAQTQL